MIDNPELMLLPPLPKSPTSMDPLPHDILSKSVVDFNSALRDLKRSAETQVQDLNRSISAIQKFSHTLPVLLESIPGPSTPRRHVRENSPDSQRSHRTASPRE